MAFSRRTAAASGDSSKTTSPGKGRDRPGSGPGLGAAQRCAACGCSARACGDCVSWGLSWPSMAAWEALRRNG